MSPHDLVKTNDALFSHRGSYSAWLVKAKQEAAKTKWFTSSTKRYFTIDFEQHLFFYRHSETERTYACPVMFADMTSADHIPHKRTASRAPGGGFEFGFVLRTRVRNFVLYTTTYNDADRWVSALNAAAAAGGGEKVCITPASQESDSTTTGSDGGGRNSSPDSYDRSVLTKPVSGEPRLAPTGEPRLAPWAPSLVQGSPAATAAQGASPTATAAWGAPASAPRPSQRPTGEARYGGAVSHGSEAAKREESPAPAVEFEAEATQGPPEDPFASLEALEELAGPPPAAAAPTGQLRGPMSIEQRLREARFRVTGIRDPQKSAGAGEGGGRAGGRPADGPRAPPPPGGAPKLAQGAGKVAAAGPPMAAAGGHGYGSAPQVAVAVAAAPPSGWDSDYEDAAAPSPVRSRAGAHPPAHPPAPAAAGAESWDSESDASPAKPRSAAPGTAAAEGTPEAPQEDSGWDRDDDPEPPLRAALPRSGYQAARGSACGAPPPPASTFVAAKPKKQATKARAGAADELDDLMGELGDLAGGAEPTGGHDFVPGFRCTGCDFRVLRVHGGVWASDAEYMFFRNYYPNEAKLRAKLRPKRGCEAYCCQCSWKSAEVGVDLADVAEGLRWKVVSA